MRDRIVAHLIAGADGRSVKVVVWVVYHIWNNGAQEESLENSSLTVDRVSTLETKSDLDSERAEYSCPGSVTHAIGSSRVCHLRSMQ